MRHKVHYLMATIASLFLVAAGCSQAAPAPAGTAAPAAAAKATEPAKAAETVKAAEPTKPAVAQPTAAPKVEFPAKGKTITIIVPSTAGGGTDIVARMTAPLMEKELGTPVQVVNKPGAGMQTGLTELTQAKPDGYTLGYLVFPTALSVYLDPERKAIFGRKDLQPIGMQYDLPMAITVNSQSPYKSFKELMDAAKANPEKIKVGTGGFMATAHLAILQLEKMAGVKFATVHFEGGGPQVNALLGGHIDVGFNIVPEVTPQIAAGSLRPLAVMAKQENSFLPGIKTTESDGFKVYASASGGIVAPAGTPKEVTDALTNAVQKATNAPEFKKKLDEMGYTTSFLDPVKYAAFWDEQESATKPLIDLAKAESKQ